MSTSLDEKEIGNRLFEEEDYEGALLHYNSGIAALSSSDSKRHKAVLYSNKAQVLLELERYEEAETAATAALDADSTFVKSLLRRATARMKIGKTNLSSLDCMEILVPSDINQYRVMEQQAEDLLFEMFVNYMHSVPPLLLPTATGVKMGVWVQDITRVFPVAIPSQPFRTMFHSPVLHHIGIPVCVAYAPRSERKGDNQVATYLMVEVDNGFASYIWQDGQVGHVIVYRSDERDITPNDLYALWDFFNDLLDDFGNEKRPNITRQYFLRWQKAYQNSGQNFEPFL